MEIKAPVFIYFIFAKVSFTALLLSHLPFVFMVTHIQFGGGSENARVPFDPFVLSSYRLRTGAADSFVVPRP